jgi:hypothetical protein
MSVINSDSVRAGASGAVTAAYTIEQSCRFNAADSANLDRTVRVAGNTRTWTLSFWMKLGNLASDLRLFTAWSDGNNHSTIYFTSGHEFVFHNVVSASNTAELKTTQVFRDPSAWYHIVLANDTTQATAGNRTRLYVNGVEVTVFTTENTFDQNEESWVNKTVTHSFCHNGSGSNDFDGYLADIHLIDGQQLAATSFGETDVPMNIHLRR